MVWFKYRCWILFLRAGGAVFTSVIPYNHNASTRKYSQYQSKITAAWLEFWPATIFISTFFYRSPSTGSTIRTSSHDTEPSTFNFTSIQLSINRPTHPWEESLWDLIPPSSKHSENSTLSTCIVQVNSQDISFHISPTLSIGIDNIYIFQTDYKCTKFPQLT